MRQLSSRRRRWSVPLAALACAAVLAGVAQAAPQALPRPPVALSSDLPAKPPTAATLEECVTADTAAGRSATFAGEMSAIAGAPRMQMRIEVLERMPGEPMFRAVTAPGLGVWRNAAAGVKIYKYLKQVTNLSAPAFYRGAVRFRWLTAKGHIVKTGELRTPRCEQPVVQHGEEGSGETGSRNTGEAR